MPLVPGKVRSSGMFEEYRNIDDEIVTSMAEYMLEALQRHWPRIMTHYPTIPFEDRFLKLFFVAVSQGVVRHLRDNPDSFKIEVPHGPGTGTGERIETFGVDPVDSTRP